MAKLFDELGRMDDTAAGFILYYDYDEIPKEQARVIHQRDLYRRRIICMAERALNNIVT